MLPETIGAPGSGPQRRSASDSSDSVALVTLAAFHGHIDFSPALQIIAGCCESYPPQLAGEELLECVDTTAPI